MVNSTNQNNDPNVTPGITNPLQTNNGAVVLIGYIAGIAAAKLPIFDFATWNYIIMSFGGTVMIAWSAYMNRKTAVVATVANLPEVKNKDGIILDKTVPGAMALAEVTPQNVVAK